MKTSPGRDVNAMPKTAAASGAQETARDTAKAAASGAAGDADPVRLGVAPAGFLAQLAPPEYDALLAMAEVAAAPRNGYVFRAGEPGSHVYFLKSGLIKIFEVSELGRETLLWFCLPGEIFGLAEAMNGDQRGVNAQACEKSQVVVLRNDRFREFLLAHPPAALLALGVLASRLRTLGHELANLMSDDVDTRIGKLLLRAAERYGEREGNTIVLRIPLTHQAISDMIGAARPTVSSALGNFRRSGVLSFHGHRIRIENEALLHKVAYR